MLLNVSPVSGAVTVLRLIQTKGSLAPEGTRGNARISASLKMERRIHSVFSEEISAFRNVEQVSRVL